MSDKALLVGINLYTHPDVPQLRGCLNDVASMQTVLTSAFGFDSAGIRCLTNGRATRANVLQGLDWLFADSQPGDRALLHFSGHGSYLPSDSGNDDDGRREIFCLVDMDWDNPDSYLTNGDLRAWTGTLPAGVQLVVVLDSCHSGNGTRPVLPPTAKPGSHPPPALMSVAVTAARVHRRMAKALGIAPSGTDIEALVSGNHPDVVHVRFLPPPPQIQSAVAATEAKRGRALVKPAIDPTMNHVLLTACRTDQTSADAFVDGGYHGAFTYFLARSLDQDGAGVDRGTLIDQVRSALRQEQFDQVPQLEGPSPHGALYMSNDHPAHPSDHPTGSDTVPGTDSSGDVSRQLLAAVNRLSHLIERLPQMLRVGVGKPMSREPGGRRLVYVHGICKHVPGYSDPWWAALHPYTTVFGDGTLGDTRLEVVWSDVVGERGFRDVRPAASDGRDEWAARIRGVLEERAAMRAVQATTRAVVPGETPDNPMRKLQPRSIVVPSAPSVRGLSVPGMNCVNDFSVYMFDNAVRSQVIGRFTDLVKQLLDEQDEIDIISHSWGTVVAYEGLRALEDEGLTDERVGTFFTVGAALSIFLVKMRLLPANRDGHKPALVREWINLNAQGDPVGGALKGNPYAVDEEFLDLPNLGCLPLDLVCAHGSYFKPENAAVNRDIFAQFINQEAAV